MHKHADTYNEIETFEYPGTVVRVHIPDLSASERSRRTKQLYKATESILKAYQKKGA